MKNDEIKDSSENENKTSSPNKATGDEVAPESNAAKILRMRGISIEENNTDPIKKTNFFENLWYHHRGAIIMISFSVIILTILIAQLLRRESPDLYIMYAGPTYLDYNQTETAEENFKSIISDYNSDGKKGIALTQLVYISSEKQEEMKSNAEALGTDYTFDPLFNSQEYERFTNEIMVGNSIICLLDPALYNEVKGVDGFLLLDEILDVVPDSAHDEYSIKFSETKFYKYFTVFQNMPDDTLLAVRRISAMSVFKGQKNMEKIHSDHLDFFKKIVSFEYPEGYEETLVTDNISDMETTDNP